MAPTKKAKVKRLDKGPKPKRSLIQAACNTCRRRKLACDGRRPTCDRCARRGDECDYATHDADETRNEALRREILQLNAKLLDVNHAFKAMQALPARAVSDLLQQAASTSDPLRAFIDGGRSMTSNAQHMGRISSVSLGDTELVRTHSRLESELWTLHPMSYPAVYNVGEVLRQVPEAIGGEPFRLSALPAPYHHAATQASDPPLTPSAPLSSLFCISCYDTRLHYLQINFWTEVDVSNELAASIISFWLSTEHPLVGCFDADLFLQDLVSRRTQFCSRLLVNALLFNACRGHLSSELGKNHLCEAFLAEAEWTLLHRNADAEPLLTLSALHMLALGLHADEKPSQALRYVAMAFQMGERLHLYGPSAATYEKDLIDSPQRFKALLITAWSTFAASVTWAYFQRETKPVRPPSLPDPSTWVNWWNKSIGYQESVHPRAADTQRTLFARIGLAQILYQILADFQQRQDVVGDVVAMISAEISFTRLVGWLDALPPSFKQTRGMPDHVAILRIWVHSIILELFRPLAHIKRPLSSLQTPDSEPEAIMAASSRQIQQLVLTAIMSYPSIRMSQHWVPPLVYASNAAIKLPHGREAAFLLKSYMTALLGLCSYFAVAASTLRGIMEIALRAGKISIKQAHQMDRQVRDREKNVQWCEGTRSTFVLDLDSGHLGANAFDAQVDRLAEEFAGRLAFEEFVEDDDAEAQGQGCATYPE